MGFDLVDLQDIEDARESLRGLVKQTPLIRSGFLSDLCRGKVYLKLENQQMTHSFKVRGALNRMLHLSAEEKRRGIVTASAGNHAQAVAIGAEMLKAKAKIVVPKSTPKVKVDGIKKREVQLILHGDIYDEAEQKALDLAKREGMAYISPYNDRFIIAGQGTIGLEILDELPKVDTIVVPVGGGGLISGVSIAAKTTKPSVQVIGVQSEASPVMYESLKAGRIVNIELKESIADGLFGGIEQGSMTFRIVQEWVDNVFLVKEETIKKAICLLWKKERQIVEGAGATGAALLMERPQPFKGKEVVLVITGGNIDEELLQQLQASRDWAY